MANKKPTVEIFRAGRHTAMNGQTINFSNADIAAIAAGYNKELHEAPVVVGHPATDAPAYAWAGALTGDDGKLCAELDQVDSGFAELVTKGRYKKISSAFYAPEQDGNPTPGKFYLRHIGFLGAQPPAVKGLKQVSFADDGATLVFADDQLAWTLSSIARLFRGVRDYLVQEKGIDEANKVIGDWDISAIEDQSVRLQTPAPATPSYSEQERDNLLTPKQLDDREAALVARESALTTRETAITTQSAAFAEADKTRRRTEDVARVDQLVKGGKVSPVIKSEILNFAARLDDGETLTFAEGADAPKVTARAFFFDLLGKSGKVINFAEVSAPGTDAVDNPADPIAFGEALASEAQTYIAEQAKNGITIPVDAAVRHVAAKRKTA